jgi:iron complex outermembrane receptor protein
MKSMLRGASGVALIIGFAGSFSAFAQEAQTVAPQAEVQQVAPAEPAAVEQVAPPAEPAPSGGGDRVVVTGSFIAGTSEDAPLPVESFSLDDLQNQGAPTAAEFLRNLSISSESFGEADSAIAGAAAGFANVNLRGLGATRTLVLLNGRRYGYAGANGVDINTLPMMAIGQIDVLKDGASVTYGAGAVGGVINYVTRKNFEGLEVSASKKMFADSDGEDSIEVLWGTSSDVGNLLVAGSYGKRHPLAQSDRDFSTQAYQIQPANWTVFDSNPGTYYTWNPATNTTTGLIRDYTVDSCRTIGGEIGSTLNTALNTSGAGGTPAVNASDCSLYIPPYWNLIDEESYYRGFLSYDMDFSDTQQIHFELAYGKTDNPRIMAGNSLPNGGKRATATNTIAAFPNGAFTVPYTQAIYNAAGVQTGTSAPNPYVVEFFNRARASGRVSSALPYQSLLVHNQWRPLMFGPNALYENGHRYERQQRESWNGAVALTGDFTEDGFFGRFLPDGTNYSLSATYANYQQEEQRPDWLISRLQDALRGYGGPGCNAVDRVATDYSSVARYDATVGIQSDTAPGTNGCQYFNPFASSFAYSFVNGAANPAYGGAGFENSRELLSWITHDRRYETTSQALTLDATYTGQVPGFELPGGPIGWALGAQWRQQESRAIAIGSGADADWEARAQLLDCPYGDQNLPANFPNQGACEAQSGPFFGSGINRRQNTFTDRQTTAYFAELQLPVLDNLNFQLAARREEFGDISGNIYKIAGKYDILPELSLRGSYSTNFQAPPDDLGVLGVQQGSTYISSLLRSLNTTIRTLEGITPEDDTGQNFGIIYAPEVFGGQLRMSADWFQYTVEGEIANTSISTALINVFGVATPQQATAANCSARFINLFTFSTGACSQGVTTASTITNVDQYTLNTGGFVNNGIDYNIDYTRDLGPGEIFAGLSATQVLVYKVKGYEVPGVNDAQGNPLVYAGDFDGLGWANLTRAGTIMPEWRGNANLRYSLENHTFGLRANYISGFDDETAPVRTGAGADGRSGTADDVFATWGLNGKDLLTFDFTYVWSAPFWQDLSLRASILNLTDRNPMAAQNTNAGGAASATRTGYYPGYGDPRGRQIEIGLTKKF